MFHSKSHIKKLRNIASDHLKDSFRSALSSIPRADGSMADTSIKLGSTVHPDLQTAHLGERLAALVIGINDYEDRGIRRLRGSVNDARDVKQYLEVDLKVSSNRIIFLENKDATRSAIVEAFQQLKALDLPYGSPILVYFAGHGTQLQYGGDGQEQMEAILPYDCTYGKDSIIHPILDKTISRLIESLSVTVGTNIIFISDCCYSGSIDRDVSDRHDSEDNTRAWPFPESYRYPVGLDDGLTDLLASDSRASGTHVLLAACSETELARESCYGGKWHGDFTRALLKLFRSTSICRLTPADVLFRLVFEKSGQNPQCHGENRKRYFFDENDPEHAWWRIDTETTSEYWVLNCGTVHGINTGAILNVFPDRDLKKWLGRLRVTEANSLFSKAMPIQGEGWETTSGPSSVAKRPWFALLHDIGEVAVRPRIRIRNHGSSMPLTAILDDLSSHKQHPIFVREQRKENDATFSIDENSENGIITLYNHDHHTLFPTETHPDLLPFRPSNPDALRRVLEHASNFFYHLNNSFERKAPPGIEIELREVGHFRPVGFGHKRYSHHKAPSGNLIRRTTPLSILKPGTGVYGIKIKNCSGSGWFVNILYFDLVQHTIKLLHGPSSSGKFNPDGCLQDGRDLELGMKLHDIERITFGLTEGRQTDFGVLKFIFTATASSLQSICTMTSLQELSRGMESVGDDEEEEEEEASPPEYEEDGDVAHTYCIPVVIRSQAPGRVSQFLDAVTK